MKLACLLIVLLVMISSVMSLLSATSLTPFITPNCISAIDTFATNSPCHSVLTSILQNADDMEECLQGGPGQQSYPTDCSDVSSVMYAANSPNQYLVRPYYLPSTPSTCKFCNETIIDSCLVLLSSISSLAGGVGNIDDLNANGGEAVADKCSNYLDFAQLTGLRYQSQLLCQSSYTFNYTVTPVNNLNDALDMRSLLQCGKCSMIPCLYGQYCGQNSKAIMCPPGYYCPDPTVKLSCPSDHYCPLGTVDPIPCRSIAAGSCTGGATREVVWVPLFISIILVFIICILSIYPPQWLVVIFGDLKVIKTARPLSQMKLLDRDSIRSVDKDNTNPGIRIEFQDLLLISGTNTRLNHLSGSVRPGKFTAIIGGSGAGKTTLMNVLLSREYQNSGKVYFYSEGSAQHLSPKTLERIVSFVPQTDVLLTEMTVYQLLKHSALTRLPIDKLGQNKHSREAMIEKKIESILDKLEIEHLRDVVAKRSVADSDVLSPGDKKKVSIAIELIAEPKVCFLDEPTTGIDASSAMAVALIIRDLATTGVTCVAVIHQPRGEIFSLIDDLIIMVPGGKLAYQGPARRALAWFAKYGFHLYHPKANKTDFILDVTSGNSDPTRGSASIEAHANAETVNVAIASAQRMKSSSSATSSEYRPLLSPIDDTVTTDMVAIDEVVNPLLTTNQDWSQLWIQDGSNFLSDIHSGRESLFHSKLGELDISRPNFVVLCGLYLKRGLLQRIKAFNMVVLSLNSLVGGAIIGIVTSASALMLPALPPTYSSSCPPGAEDKCTVWIRFEIGPASFLITMLVGAVAVSAAVSTFGREKEYLAREVAVGSNLLAYYVGKVLADIIVLVLAAFVFSAALVSIGPWASPFDLMFLVVFSIFVCFSSMAYLLSLGMSDPDNATLFGVILAILLNLFGGFVPKLGDDPVGKIFLTHYCARAICTVELQQGMKLSDSLYDSVVPDAWMNPNWHLDVLAIWGFSLLFNLMAFAVLKYKNPRRYKPNK